MLKDIELMMRMRFCGHILYHRYPLSMSQNRILLMLKHDGTLTQKEILERMNIKPGSLSEIISKVESGGYVVRHKCKDDKRSFELTLTDSGTARAEIFEKELDEMAKEIFSPLTKSQKEELFKILGVLENEWVKVFDIKHPPCHTDKGDNNA